MSTNPFANMIKLPVDYDSCSSAMRKLVREQYVRIQSGRCKHCNQPLDGPPTDEVEKRYIDLSLFPPGFFNHPVHLHHSHETGKTIGAIHARCNAFLWQYKGE